MLRFTGQCDIQAAAGEGKRPTFKITAYTGAVMNVSAFYYPIILEMSGIKAARKKLPVLLDHDPARIVGQGVPHIGDESVTIEGGVTGDDADAQKVVSHAKNGFEWQASIGAQVTRREFLEAGKKATVNGREVTGPLFIARESILHEVSFVAIGADGSTSATVAAKVKGKVMSLFGKRKPAEQPVEDIDDGGDVATLTAAEEIRVSRVNALFSGADWTGIEGSAESLRTEAIAEGMELSEVKKRMTNLRELRDLRASRPQVPGGISGGISGGGAGATTPQLLTASLMLRSGHEHAAVKAYGEKTVQQAHDLRVRNLLDLCAAALRMERFDVPADRNEMLKAAFSTVSLPSILSNTLGRSLVPYYEEAVSEVLQFATVKSAANFKAQTDIRPSSVQSLAPLPPSGEIQHGHPKEEDSYTWSISTFARMLTITRTDIINDDLGAFDSMPSALSMSASRALLDLVWTLILGGESAGHFSSGNGNLLESGSALAIGTLATAVKTFRDQRDNAGNNIGIAPAVLCVPTALETTGRVLLNSTEIVDGTATASQPNGNPVSGIVPQLLVEPRMSNSDKFSGTSSTAYYLFGGPASHALIVGFLDGKRTPTVETEQAPFNTLGVSLRCFHDFGVAFGDPRAALKATGAA